MEYCEKYDPDNYGLKYVFNKFYKTMNEMGIVSNVVASCGEDFDRYVKYALSIAKTASSRITFVENNANRFKRLKRKANKLGLDRLQILHGDITTYESLPGIKLKWPSRVEDLELGVRFDKLIYKVMPRLDLQRNAGGTSGRYRLKAQIIGGARKYVSDDRAFRLLQQYFSLLGAKLAGINGHLPASRHDDNFDSNVFFYGREIAKYTGKKLKWTYKVYEHETEFLDLGRIISVKLLSYTNGGNMLCCLVIYK